MALSVLDDESKRPGSILEAIRTARPYAEGGGVWVDVKCRPDVENLKRLIEIKMAN